MGVLKKDFKYKYVKNFFTEEELELGKYYYLLSHKRNRRSFDDIQNNNGDSYFSHDAFTDTLLMKKLNRMQSETGLSLFPTYAFSRVYSHNAVLTPHKDRPSCEVSVTAMWGSCGTPWPIFMEDKEIEIYPGDAVIYLGCELNHYRNHFEGDWHAQTFLHYVDQDGPFKDYKFDQRNVIMDPIVEVK